MPVVAFCPCLSWLVITPSTCYLDWLTWFDWTGLDSWNLIELGYGCRSSFSPSIFDPIITSSYPPWKFRTGAQLSQNPITPPSPTPPTPPTPPSQSPSIPSHLHLTQSLVFASLARCACFHTPSAVLFAAWLASIVEQRAFASTFRLGLKMKRINLPWPTKWTNSALVTRSNSKHRP